MCILRLPLAGPTGEAVLAGHRLVLTSLRGILIIPMHDLDCSMKFMRAACSGVCMELEQKAKWSFDEEPEIVNKKQSRHGESMEDRILCR